jgi:hypothetical protein
VPIKAIDGKENSRWASLGPNESRRQLTPNPDEVVLDDQWLMLDMKTIVFIESIKLEWERAYSRDYDIEVSESGEDGSWNVVSNGNNGEGGKVQLSMLNTLGRFVRIYSYEGDRNYGISLFEVKIFGDADAGCTAPPILPTGGSAVEPPLLLILSLLRLPHKRMITSRPKMPSTATSIRDGRVRGPTTSGLSWISVRPCSLAP